MRRIIYELLLCCMRWCRTLPWSRQDSTVERRLDASCAQHLRSSLNSTHRLWTVSPAPVTCKTMLSSRVMYTNVNSAWSTPEVSKVSTNELTDLITNMQTDWLTELAYNRPWASPGEHAQHRGTPRSWRNLRWATDRSTSSSSLGCRTTAAQLQNSFSVRILFLLVFRAADMSLCWAVPSHETCYNALLHFSCLAFVWSTYS